jgi:hypothetical protein
VIGLYLRSLRIFRTAVRSLDRRVAHQFAAELRQISTPCSYDMFVCLHADIRRDLDAITSRLDLPAVKV